MATQDRRSNMINSSVNQPAKKSGAGGSYTWGTAMDVTDYAPVGITQPVGVVTAQAPTIVTQTVAAPAFKMSDDAFPALGGGPAVTGVPASVVQANTRWGPALPRVLGDHAVRSSAVVGQQQPRNLFAKPANMTRRAENTQVVAQAQEGTIDWSKAGIPQAVVQTIVKSPQAMAHLGQYGTAAPQVPLETLQVQNRAAQAGYAMYTPTVAKPTVNVVNNRAVAGGVKQPCGGGR